MSRFWSAGIDALEPYVPGEQPRLDSLIKLNTNECPWPPSEKVLDAIRAAADGRLRLYPDPVSLELRRTIADYYDVAPEQVFVGNGSDEVLAHAFRALLRHDAPLLFPDVTYSFYPVYCRLFDIAYEQIPLREDFSLVLADYDRPNGGIIFPNPNAPTGRAVTLAEIEALLERNRDSVVVVDEAYVDFGAETAVPLVARHPNLLVVQTLSKSRALAGMRVGFAIGSEELIEGLTRVKDSFNSYPLDRLAQVAAQAAFEDEAWFQRTRQAVMAERARVSEALARLGCEVVPSQANFVLARPPKPAESVMEALRARHIIVRHFSIPRVRDWLRITIGTPEQNDALIAALEEILA
ncbi:histidinol-phosphate transaminase [Sulfurivirga sp.]|uniref:histidinol-phosphate transaminase n=1 Tax=Sulfurivirga sp. TaxID=2614236 RepID=UPI0025F7A7B2|nr:histidinol-phosphate transaminase [Sulfurivirga sp.]